MKTVADLIAELQKLEPSLPVMVDGYEGGYLEPSVRQKLLVHLGYRAYSGPYEDAVPKPYGQKEEDTPFNAVVLSRMGPED